MCFASLVLLCAPAHATRVPPYCKTFTELRQEIPKEVRWLGKLMIRSCDDGYSPRAYLLLPPVPGRYGVCNKVEIDFKPTRYIDHDPDNEPIIENEILDFVPNTRWVWKLAAIAPCPTQDSDQYIFTADVTDGVFAAIARAWERARSSPAAFDSTFSRAAMEQGETVGFAAFRILTLSEPGIAINSVGTTSINESLEVATDAPSTFQLTFLDPEDSSRGFRVLCDFGTQGVEFLRFSTWIS
jgi:hypothetical protein